MGHSNDQKTVKELRWVGVSVRDLDAATAFHGSAARLDEVASGDWADDPTLDELAGRSGVKARTRTLSCGNAQLRFMQLDPPPAEHPIVPVYGPGIAHVCYQAASSTGTYGRFLERGARPIGLPELIQLNPPVPVHYAYARDHDGIMFEVEHVDLEALKPEQRPALDRRIRHVSLATRDIARLADFFSALLDVEKPRRAGWKAPMSGERIEGVSGLPGASLSMAWLEMGPFELEIIQYWSHPTELPEAPRPFEAPGYNVIVLDVTGSEAAREKVVAAGGTVLSAPRSLDGGEAVFARDPDGNLLGLRAT